MSHFAISLLFDEDTDDDVLAHKLRFNDAIVIVSALVGLGGINNIFCGSQEGFPEQKRL